MYQHPRVTVRHPLALLAALMLLGGCQTSPGDDDTLGSQVSTPSPAGVAAAHPLAVEAGLAVLGRGGSAADAAVAVQSMLSLVEPQSSGIGGGAFMLYFDAASERISAFDGRETAPAGATPDMLLDDTGQPLSFIDAILGGRATGVPGVMPMLGAAHARHGKLPWSTLFDEVIETAEHGFSVPERLARFANSRWPQAGQRDVRELFTKSDGAIIQAGDILQNPAFAATLRRLASEGPAALHTPPLSSAIIERTRAEPLPGTLVQADFDAYEPRVVEPICGAYLVYTVCVPPPPSSGVSLLQMLAILERTDIAERGPEDAQAWLLFAEASRLMYADRDQYVADPAFVEVPVDALRAPDYVAARAALIGDRAGAAPAAGTPPGFARGADATVDLTGTSHYVIVDAEGNVATSTTSVESLFGSGRAVEGFFLNNQLTDFSFRPSQDGHAIANAVAPGKRPRSSMTPVIVLDADGQLVAALGSPGGSAILVYNAKVLVAMLAWHLTLQQAIDLPNLVAFGENFYGEATRFSPRLLEELAALGIEVTPGRGEESGLHGVVFHADGRVEGAADPRREGVWRALGQTR
ncbi:MAG: gamma-glutamyltransferase family protein [Gammaproteobacteria bacterium]|nr:gamma-glutamyltransferase family protein [Gammaproteobacteria bacterium]